METNLLLMRHTMLNAVVQYLDAKYDDFVYQTPVGNAPPATGCTYARSTTITTLYGVDCSGKRAFQSPKWTVNLGGEQTIELGDTKIVLNLDTQYRTRRVSGFDYLPFQIIGPDWTTNAQIGVSPAGLPVTVTAYVQNIENHRIPVTSYSFGIGSTYSQITTPPRTYGIRLSARF